MGIIRELKTRINHYEEVIIKLMTTAENYQRNQKCLGYRFENNKHGCHYNTTLSCDDCIYGTGRKQPRSKCNQLKEDV